MGGACGTYWGEQKCTSGFCWGNLKLGDVFEDLIDVDGTTILTGLVRKFGGRRGLELSGSGQGKVSGRSVQDGEIPFSKTCGEFDCLMNDDRF